MMSGQQETTGPRRAEARLRIKVPLLPRFLRREDGNGTIEFCVVFPVFMLIFISTFDVGLLMVRQVMLDRGVDITVRALRLGQLAPENENDSIHDLLKRNVCSISGILPNCMDNVMIELRPVDGGSNLLAASPTCVDKDLPVQPATNPKFGQQNEMMLVRVCALLKPMFPATGIGMQLTQEGEYYALVSTSAFVNEPS